MQAVLTARGIRDRLMHPRSPESLVVSNAELEAVDRALEFWRAVDDELHQGGTEEDE